MGAIVNMPTYEAYKDSGIEWLGEVPAEWQFIALKHLLEFHTGGTPSTGNQEFYNGNLPWITIADLDGRYTNKSHYLSKLGVRQARIPLTPKGSLLYSFKLSIGQVSFASENLYTNEAIASFLPKIGINLRYYFYALPLFLEMNAATNIYGALLLNQDLIKNAMILNISTDEQQRIANFLDQKTAQIDEAIAIKDQQIALLKERKQIIIQKAVTQGLDQDVSMKESGVDWIGEIPEHWEVVALAYALNAVGDVDHYMPETIDTGVPYFMTGDLEDLVSQMSFDDCKKVSYRDYNKLTKKIKTEVGDVILARYATIGTVTYVDINEEFLVSYSCVTIKTDKKFLNGMYLFYFLKSDTFAQAVSKVVNTNTQGNVGIGDLKKIKIALPPLREQERLVRSIAKRLSEIDVVIEAQVNQISKLKEYKTTLINSAVTGKIRITPEMVA